MDIQIRSWSEELNRAVTRYGSSEFQPNTDAVTLKYKLIEVMRDEEEYSPLDCIEPCGLRTISGALHTGVKTAN